MRKALGLLSAATLLVSIAVVAAAPAGSAANTKFPKCKSITGTSSYKPGLPIASSKTLVKPKNTVALVITGCTGAPGITKGTSNGTTTAKTATNCAKLFADAKAKKPAAATTGTIKWSNGQTSTTSNVLTVTGLSKDGKSLLAKLVSKYTAGLGKGKTSTAQLTAVPNAGWCSTKPLSKVTVKSTSIK